MTLVVLSSHYFLVRIPNFLLRIHLMKFSAAILLAVSMAAVANAVPLERRAAPSAGPTNVVDNYGGGIGGMPNMRFSRMMQHGDGQNPVIMNGDANQLAGGKPIKSRINSAVSSGKMKTVYHNNNLGVSVPSVQEQIEKGKQQMVSMLELQLQDKNLSPEQSSMVRARLADVTSSGSGSTRKSHAKTSHSQKRASQTQIKNKGPKRLDKLSSQQNKLPTSSRKSSKRRKQSSISSSSSALSSASSPSTGASVAKPTSVSLNAKSSALLSSASALAQSILKRDGTGDAHAFQAVQSLSDGETKVNSKTSTHIKATKSADNLTQTTETLDMKNGNKKSMRKCRRRSKTASTNNVSTVTVTTSSKPSDNARERDDEPSTRKSSSTSHKKSSSSTTSSKTSTSSKHKSSSKASPTSRSQDHGVTVSQGSSEVLHAGKTMSLGDDSSGGKSNQLQGLIL